MDLLSPRIAPGIGVAMARVASRFFFFSILLVASTIYLPHKGTNSPYGLILLAITALGLIAVLSWFPWDKYTSRVFTVSYLISSSVLLSLLVYLTGGIQSSYSLLYILIIFFSFFYNVSEMYAITTVVSLFYLLPYVYDTPEPYSFTTSAITVLFFYFGTYILHTITRFVLKKNQVLEELNEELVALFSLTSGLMADLKEGALPESFAATLKDHIPTTYCIVMLLDEENVLSTRIASPLRSVTWEPLIGTAYAVNRLPCVREVMKTRQPRLYQLEMDHIDDDLKMILTKDTCSVLVVPIRISSENMGVMIFGEERQWSRFPFTNEKIQLAIAISKQVATGLSMWWCYERLNEARRDIQISRDKVIKAERLATLGEVTRAVEHEINNPLSVIVNWAEIYRADENIDSNMRNKFQVIYEMSLRIMEVIRKLSEMKDPKSVEFMKGQKMTEID